jgi:hypothetical protein
MAHRRRGLDLHHEPLGAEHCGEFGFEDLDGDLAVVLEVRGDARAELTLDAVVAREGGGESGKCPVRQDALDAAGVMGGGCSMRKDSGRGERAAAGKLSGVLPSS